MSCCDVQLNVRVFLGFIQSDMRAIIGKDFSIFSFVLFLFTALK